MSDTGPTLETFPNPHPGRDYLIDHYASEFTSLCPITGQPDFGKLRVQYVPADKCVELRSLKLYLHGFRSTGAFYEDVTNRILDDLVASMEPKWLRVSTTWNVRGGIRSVITAEHGKRPPDLGR